MQRKNNSLEYKRELLKTYAKGKANETSDVDLLISANVSGIKSFGLVE